MSIEISAASVKELRERTGAAMMDCKKALVESSGNMDEAIEILRKKGAAKADKKADRTAAEGVVATADNGKRSILLELNCETDFVSRDQNFLAFVDAVLKAALQAETAEVEAISALTLPSGKTVEEARLELITKIGENVKIRRAVLTQPSAATVGAYLHGSRIGVVVELDVDNKELARDIAMHIAASRPLVTTPDMVPAEVIAKEKDIYLAQAAGSGKPQEIVEKMVAGRLKKYLDEVSLTGQPFVKDPDITVGSLLNKHRAKVLAFHRYEVGEGIEKVTEDFREAVMSQIQGG